MNLSDPSGNTDSNKPRVKLSYDPLNQTNMKRQVAGALMISFQVKINLFTKKFILSFILFHYIYLEAKKKKPLILKNSINPFEIYKIIGCWEVKDTWRHQCYWGPTGCNDEPPDGQV